MNKTVIVLLAAAIALAVPFAWAAKKKTIEETIKESMKAADQMTADMAQEREAEKKAMEDYWDAQPDAPAVLPGKFLETLRKLPWPELRPVPKEKYFTRPEIKAGVPADGEEDDPLLAGSWKKERAAQKDLKALRKESDDARFALWLRNIDYFAKALDGCKAGATEGAERVKIMESALVFIKEGEPEFHLRAVADEGVKLLKKMEAVIKELASELYRRGEYIPDHKDLNMAEKISGRLAFPAGDPEPLTEKEKQRYYKVADRFARLDPRAPDAAAQGAPVRYAAGGGAKDARREEFLRGLVGRCNKTISGLNLMAAQPSDYPALIAKVEKEINAILASFPPGWQKYPRARWAHDWFSGALEKAKKSADPGARGKELFRALNDFEAGLGE